MSKSTRKPAQSPASLSKTGKKVGIELSETQLDLAAGGMPPIKTPLRVKDPT